MIKNLQIKLSEDAENGLIVMTTDHDNHLVVIRSRDGGIGVVVNLDELRVALSELDSFTRARELE